MGRGRGPLAAALSGIGELHDHDHARAMQGEPRIAFSPKHRKRSSQSKFGASSAVPASPALSVPVTEPDDEHPHVKSKRSVYRCGGDVLPR